MSITVPLYGFGGDNTLNFKIVGGIAEPFYPKENTIWVLTENEINGWIFSAKEPETKTEGMVWICTGTSSPVEFNALKNNCVQVYPISAKQYIDGAWVSKTAKSYQNGSWKDFIAFLYNAGDEFTDITGGWVTESYGSTPSKTIAGDVMQFVTLGNPWEDIFFMLCQIFFGIACPDIPIVNLASPGIVGYLFLSNGILLNGIIQQPYFFSKRIAFMGQFII